MWANDCRKVACREIVRNSSKTMPIKLCKQRSCEYGHTSGRSVLRDNSRGCRNIYLRGQRVEKTLGTALYITHSTVFYFIFSFFFRYFLAEVEWVKIRQTPEHKLFQKIGKQASVRAREHTHTIACDDAYIHHNWDQTPKLSPWLWLFLTLAGGGPPRPQQSCRVRAPAWRRHARLPTSSARM